MTVPLAPTAGPDASFAEDWARWHREHELRRADPHGFLAVTGLHWLTGQPQRLPGVPGEWSTGADGPLVTLGPGEELVVDGHVVRDRHAFGPIAERDGRTARAGEVEIEVARRGGHDIVRPRDPAHPLRTQHRGTPTFAPDPRWVVPARYQPFPAPRPTTVGAAVEGLEHVYDAPGRVVFAVDGQELALTAFAGAAPGSLFLLFTDVTSGVTTYAANRSLAVDAPAADGTVTLDFNRATNLPCAYTDFATCPLPPAENRLPVAVEAGEQIPTERR
ncbi:MULTISPECIES: DUF1684 domain-containing protein [unclassified Blastococcus]|uniref:DUF1684 domain-containing protein n=1 Tax=unclassified Blastococcus TaxID=2619396 RepID=UPI0028158DB8|nr:MULTISPECIES: DUF1684 domain-containing protein [unclassified Blastococcus]